MKKLWHFLGKEHRSFSYAVKGLRYFTRSGPHPFAHLLATVLVAIACCCLPVSRAELLALIICIALVWVAEMLNSCLEQVLDLLHPSIHPVAGRIKDMAAGAVLVAAFASLIIGLIIFIPKIKHLL